VVALDLFLLSNAFQICFLKIIKISYFPIDFAPKHLKGRNIEDVILVKDNIVFCFLNRRPIILPFCCVIWLRIQTNNKNCMKKLIVS